MASIFQFAQSVGALKNTGDAEAGTTATVINTSDTTGVANGDLIQFTTGAQAGRRRKIASFIANTSITVDAAFPAAPATGNLYEVLATADIGAGAGNHFNFKNADTTTPSDYSANPITAGNSSYEVYINGHWTGAFNAITANLVWMSTLSVTGYGTGAAITGSVPTDYVAPTTATNADADIPTVEGSALNPTVSDGVGSPDVGVAGFSKFVRMQLKTGSDASPGDGGSSTLTFKWSES
jgi:hypothetical protein